MRNTILCLLMAFTSFSGANTLTIAGYDNTTGQYRGFTNVSNPSAVPPTTGATWDQRTAFTQYANPLTLPSNATDFYCAEWRITGLTGGVSSGQAGYIRIHRVDQKGNPTGNPNQDIANITLPAKGQTSIWQFTGNYGRFYYFTISQLVFDKPINSEATWRVQYYGCGTNNTGVLYATYDVGYYVTRNQASGCDINFTPDFNVQGMINHPVNITDTGLSKSKCTTGNKYSLSFVSNNSNVKIVPPNNGTPTQSYTIGDVSTIANGNFPYYRVESGTAGKVTGTIQLNLTSK
ncbi:TPA: hypothetical protein SI451_000322 [Escherichia coli]|nr:hypothetical protein [Escherichia coli]